jgi:uncharacterized membrane protein YjjB (DUF3815 family)
LWAGICGIAVALLNHYLSKLKINNFFATILSAFVMALIAYSVVSIGLSANADTIIIGTLMILVPGLLFTNALRDMIFGDTNSGINRVVQVFLVAAAIALGTGAAWKFCFYVFGSDVGGIVISHPLLIDAIACFVGCFGFVILFNIHGPGGLLCALGGTLTWLVYLITMEITGNDLPAYFWGTLFAALYSEAMARIRKYPAISYLVVSIFPLIPGAGVYYTMNHAVRGDMEAFAAQGMYTGAIAGIMAIGILMVSTTVRIYHVWRTRK